jgi:gas vesicle protein
MTSFKETYEYCEQLIDDQLTKTLKELLSKWDEETDPFVDKKKQELKELYEHLENIQNMKTSYLSGR